MNAEVSSEALASVLKPDFESDKVDEGDGMGGFAFRLNANLGFGAEATLSFSSDASSSFNRYGLLQKNCPSFW